jgi:hypothetical protein
MRFLSLYVAAAFLFSGLSTAKPIDYASAFNCDEREYTRFEPNVCSMLAYNGPETDDLDFYAVENRMSLTRPHVRSVMLYHHEGRWTLQAFVARSLWTEAEAETFITDMRKVHMPVEASRVEIFEASLRDAGLDELKPDRRKRMNVCLDGSTLAAKLAVDGNVTQIERDTCQGRNDIDAFAEALMSLAIELDPGLASYAYSMTLPQEPNDPS